MGDGRGPKLALLELSRVERDVLEGWVRRSKTAQALALRARIVLACAEGLSNSEVSRRLGVSLPTVGKWRKRFVVHRLDGLSDEPRPGAPRRIADTQVEAVIVKTLEEQPANRDSHWSTRSMAEATGMSQTAISRIWRAFGLKPHLVDTWKLSADPLFIDTTTPRSNWTCTWSATTTPPIRPLRYGPGRPRTRGSTSTSPRPRAVGSTSSNAGSPN